MLDDGLLISVVTSNPCLSLLSTQLIPFQRRSYHDGESIMTLIQPR